MLIGLRLLDCTGLKVIGCGFQLEWAIGVANFGAGIFANGNCTGLSVRAINIYRAGSSQY